MIGLKQHKNYKNPNCNLVNQNSQEYTYEFTSSCYNCGQCETTPKIIQITNSNHLNDVKCKLDQDTCDVPLESEYHDILYYIRWAIVFTTEEAEDCPRARSGMNMIDGRVHEMTSSHSVENS